MLTFDNWHLCIERKIITVFGVVGICTGVLLSNISASDPFCKQITIQADMLPCSFGPSNFISVPMKQYEYSDMQQKAEFTSSGVNISYPIRPVLNTILHLKSIFSLGVSLHCSSKKWLLGAPNRVIWPFSHKNVYFPVFLLSPFFPFLQKVELQRSHLRGANPRKGSAVHFFL